MTLDDLLRDPAALSRFGTGVDVTGQLLGALGHIGFAKQTQQAAGYQAAQLRQNAGQAQAASQFAAQDVQDRTDMITSRAIAVAAASGGGASDPTVVNTLARVAAEGAYRKSVALYQGDERARAMEQQAEATEYEGASRAAAERNTAIGGFFGAGTSVLKGYAKDSSLRLKYGGKGPDLSGTKQDSTSSAFDYGVD